ncbi:MAG: flagellar protein FlaG [Lachnospiraceae bacterium]|nr:flagellar protein FlaG [Lachnospiraceae bacterium]
MAGIETIGTLVSFQATATNAVKPIRNMQPTEPGMEAKAEEVSTATETAPVKEAKESAEEKNAAEYAEQQQQQNQTAQQATNEQIKKAVEQFNKHFGNSEAVFGIHDDTNRVTIKIVDKQTKEVIKELPPEKTLDMIARVWEMAGILVDEKR